MSRESMVFYRSFHEATKNLPQKQYKEVLTAIFDYALNGTEPKLSATSQSIFLLVKPQIDANNKRFENGCKGGRKPKVNQNETKGKPNGNQSITNIKPNDNDNDNENVNVNNKRSKNKFCDFKQSDIDFEAIERKVFKN